MRTVHEVSKISGVSVRTLHHYDAIGLLKPSAVTAAGYRLYDQKALERLQMILMFRELGFALADIKKIVDSPDFDVTAALKHHIEMLTLQKEHIEGLILSAQEMMKGENADFKAFDNTKMKKYAEEVKEKWGKTAAYRESEVRMKNKSETEKLSMADGLMQQFASFGKIKHLPPDSAEAAAAVKGLQDYITANFYTCTDEILSGLGEMYISDARFTKNIDKAGGKGTAEFVSKAIKIYCR